VIEKLRLKQEALAASDSRSAAYRSASPTGSALEDDEHMRPSLYSHKPQRRLDEFDRASFEGQSVLDALRLRSFEGFYNLSFLLLCFALAYLIVRNILSNGLQGSWEDFTCSQVVRDTKLLWSLIGVCVAWTLTVFLITKLFTSGWIGQYPFFALGASSQVCAQLCCAIGLACVRHGG
jgi:hypothetical protein